MSSEPAENEATAQIDPTSVKLLSAQRAGVELTYPDFTYRHNWGPRNGWWLLNLTDSRIRSSSNVFVSISELDDRITSENPIPEPMMGAARFSVYNVAPRNGGVEIRIYIDYPDPLLTQVSYLVVNP